MGALEDTSALLSQLLVEHPRYRRRWQEVAVRRGLGTVNRTAVARVVLAWLNASGQAPTGLEDERQLLDLVRRALDGQVLTPRTLLWFVEAFEMDATDRERVWLAYGGGAA